MRQKQGKATKGQLHYPCILFGPSKIVGDKRKRRGDSKLHKFRGGFRRLVALKWGVGAATPLLKLQLFHLTKGSSNPLNMFKA